MTSMIDQLLRGLSDPVILFGHFTYLLLIISMLMRRMVALRLIAVYTIAAAIAGAAGALLAQTTGFASLDVFDFHRSAEVLLVLVIGGTGYLYGGVFGAIVFKLLHDLISAWTPQYWNFWLGLFLVVLVLVGRERLIRPHTGWRRRPVNAAAAASRHGEGRA